MMFPKPTGSPQPLTAIDLFTGTQSVADAVRRRGWDVLTLDNDPACGADITGDIGVVRLSDVPRAFWKPDLIWASPPCTTFSVASMGKHWPEGMPGGRAQEGIRVLGATLTLINQLRPRHFVIENPRGMMRKLPIMASMTMATVTYCQYGDDRMKPTDLWHDLDAWKPRPMCRNGDPCHVRAPRGAKTGTQGLSTRDRGRVPAELIAEIAGLLESQPRLMGAA